MVDETGGFLNVFKPVGITSHDVVEFVRGEAPGAKVGHAGTLDPAACGTLLLMVNKATKLSAAAVGLEKQYRVEATFGIRTSTGDAEGEVTETGSGKIVEAALIAAMENFTGEIEQTPPMTAAIKVGGKKLYKLAHKGIEIERPSRKVNVKSIRILDFYERDGLSRALLDVECSGGTYIRTLVEDIGGAMGVPACVSFLMRTRVGLFAVSDSVTTGRLAEEGVARHIVAPEKTEESVIRGSWIGKSQNEPPTTNH